jgi:hypothetical protein
MASATRATLARGEADLAFLLFSMIIVSPLGPR